MSNKKSDFWSPCVRDFVALQPEAARDVLGEALSQYGTAASHVTFAGGLQVARS